MKSQTDDKFNDSVGTFHFFSPEMCNGDITEYSGRAADIWATGVVLYALTFNKLPFDSENATDVFQQIMNSPIDFDSREISDGLRDLLSRMLKKDPSERITLDQMKNVKWLNEGYTVSLAEHGAKILANLSNNDLKTNGVTSEEIAIANTVVNRIQA